MSNSDFDLDNDNFLLSMTAHGAVKGSKHSSLNNNVETDNRAGRRAAKRNKSKGRTRPV